MRLLCAVCLVFLASVQAEYRCKDYEGADIRGRLEEGMRLMKLGELKRAEGCMVGALRDAERGRGTTQADEAMTPAVCNTGELYKKMGNCERGLPLLLHCVDRLASTATSLTAMLAANPNDEHTNQLRIILEQRALNFFHAGDTLRKLNATRKQLTTLFKDRQEGLYTDIHNVLSERLIFRRGKSLNRADIHNAAGEASAVLYKEAAVQFSEIVAKRFSKASVKNARYGLGVAHHNIGAALTENLPAKAVDAYREAIRHAPTQGESYTNLAQLTKGIEPDKAYTLFKSGFERAPENAECRNKYFTYVMAEYKTEDACREVSAHSDSFTERETLQFAECLLLPLNEPARGFKTLKRAVRAVVGRGDETEIHTAADIVYNTATALMARSDLRSYATKTFDVSLDMMMCNTHLEALQDGSAERGERAASCAYGLNNKGIVQERAGDMVSARHSYEFALLFLPSFARAKTNLAGIMRSEDSDVAESLLLEVLADEPSFGEAANNLANIYATSRRLENAAPLYAKAAEALSSFDTILNFAHTLKRICAWGTLHATLLQLKRKISANSTDGSTVADTPRVLHLLSLYGTQFLSVRSLSTPQSWGSVASIPLVTHMTILRQGALTADSQHLVQQVRTHRDTPDKGIALVASDFRRHPVGYALLALEGSGLACFHVGDAGEDELTDVLSLGCTSYSQHLGNGRRQEEVLLEVEEGTQYVLHHAVLVDVNGNTEGGAERLFTAIDSARRGGEQSFYLYPTLVAFLGYPESYGLQYDYFLSDVHTLPPSSVHPKISRGGVRTEFFFEHIVYLCPAALSGSALQRYTTEGADATEEAAEVSDSVEAFLSEHPDLPDRQSRLCYTGQHYKITPTIFSVWTAVLSRAPNTVLLLPEWEGTLRLKEEASSRGVLHQIITLPFLDYALYRQFHASLCGLSLDTDVYSGHMSAMDALISGTPLLTLPGGNARSRMASSLVRTMRKDSDIFVAGSYREYEDTAVRFVTQTAEEYAVVQEKGVFTEEEMAAAGEQYRHSAEQGLAMVARLRLMKEKSHIIPQVCWSE